MQKKKILHLITGLEVGGAEMMLLKTLPYLQKDFENKVCCIKGHGPIGKELEKKGIEVFYLELNRLNFPFVVFKFGKIIKDFKPDLLVNYLIHADLFGRIFGKIFGIKKIISNQRGFYLNWKSLRKIDHWTKFLVTKYFVQTNYARNVLMHLLKLPKEKISVIPNVIILEEFDVKIEKNTKKEELKIPQNNLNLICVSNLRIGKGYEELLEAFEKSYIKFKNISLLIVGDGDQKDKYFHQIENYESKKNIFFLGRRNDVKEILYISDIFVFATHSEGMSNALMEAMASKLAIATTNIEVNKELIENEKTGLLFPIKNAEEISRKINLLIEKKEKRIELGNNAYKKIQEFEMAKIVNIIKDNYNKIIYGR